MWFQNHLLCVYDYVCNCVPARFVHMLLFCYRHIWILETTHDSSLFWTKLLKIIAVTYSNSYDHIEQIKLIYLFRSNIS